MSINKLQLKRSAVVGKIPTTASLDLGEIAINTVDGKIYFKQQDSGSVQRILELTSTSGSHLSASYAATSSFSSNFKVVGPLVVSGSETISGSLVVTGDITAQRLLVQTITSSIIYSSGSNQLGDATVDIQTLIGSVLVSGSLALTGSASVSGSINVVGGNISIDSVNVLDTALAYAIALG
jgi:hypothetical protein